MTRPPEPVAAAPEPPLDVSRSEGAAESADGKGFFEWVFRRRALARASGVESASSPRQRELHRRARLALELADRTLDAVDPLRAGSGAALAIGLYREAVYWALAWFADTSASPGENASESDARGAQASFEDLWAAADPAVIAAALPGSIDRVGDLLITRTFVDHAGEHESVQNADATVLKGFATALVTRAGAPQAAIERYARQRFVRTCALLLVVIAMAASAVLGLQVLMRTPDLAKGKPWRASSSWGDCEPAKRQCGPVTDTGIFFHTNEDASPWVEIDLGTTTAFSSLTVKNRTDCCPDRAVPLVVEVGSDQKTWAEVARKTDIFTTWTPRFAVQHARYVRIRVDRKSWLHLDKVAVHP